MKEFDSHNSQSCSIMYEHLIDTVLSRKDLIPEAKKIEVNNIVIDDSKEFKNITPKFIKIDVEGAEGLVIQGMKKLLEKNNIKLLIECSEIGRNDTRKILKKLNYKCFRKDNLKKEITSFNNYRNNDFLWIK